MPSFLALPFTAISSGVVLQVSRVTAALSAGTLVLEEGSAEAEAAGRAVWARTEALTAGLAAELAEQLRLILEPTLASRLAGEYRTGKRLNMRRVIAFVASHFRKDKIWMRRSRPDKRKYQVSHRRAASCRREGKGQLDNLLWRRVKRVGMQVKGQAHTGGCDTDSTTNLELSAELVSPSLFQVVIAVDDSKSMGENGCGAFALEALTLICRAMARLEVGELGVVRFGGTSGVMPLQVLPLPACLWRTMLERPVTLAD